MPSPRRKRQSGGGANSIRRLGPGRWYYVDSSSGREVEIYGRVRGKFPASMMNRKDEFWTLPVRKSRSQLDTICRSGVSPTYIVSAVKSASYLLLSAGPTKKAKKKGGGGQSELASFAIIKDRKPEMYIDVICAERGSRYGKPMMRAVENFARYKRGFRRIALSSLPSAVSFYVMLGFVESDDPCSADPKIRKAGSVADGYRMKLCICSPSQRQRQRGHRK